jgi:hypothetical protein
MPTRRASSRLDQCVAPSGTSSSVRTTTSSTCASVMVRGTPGRGSSVSPSSLPQEPRPPPGDRLAVDAQPRRDREIAAAPGAGQHDPRLQRQALRGAAALRTALEPFRRDDGVWLGAAAWLVTATRSPA